MGVGVGQASSRDSYIDDSSMDEFSEEFGASHRCSMVKRYHSPTFFPSEKDKLMSVGGSSDYSSIVLHVEKSPGVSM